MISTYEFLATWLRARFSDSERGASLVEYALLVALIAVVCIVAITILGENASTSLLLDRQRDQLVQLSSARRGGLRPVPFVVLRPMAGSVPICQGPT